MSRGDENLDKMFKEAYSGQEHAFDPTFWEGVQPQLKTPPTPWYMAKSFMLISTLTVLGISSLLVSDSTPEIMEENFHIKLTEQITPIPTQQTITKEKAFQFNEIQSNNKTYNTDSYNINNEPTVNLDQNNNLPTNSKTDLNKKASSNSIKNESSFSRTESPAIDTSSPVKKALVKMNHSSLIVSGAISNPVSSISSSNQPSNATEKPPVSVKQTRSANTEAKDQSNPTISKSFKDNESPSTKRKTTENVNITSVAAVQAKSGTNYSTDYLTSSNIQDKSNTSLFSINFMDSRNLKQLPFSPFQLNSVNTKSQPHKTLNKPFTTRLMAGYMWTKPLHTNTNGITTSATNTNIELSLEYQFHKRWGVQLGIDINSLSENQLFVEQQTKDASYFEYSQSIITLKDSTWWLGGWYNYPDKQDTLTELYYINKTDTLLKKHSTNYISTWLEVPLLVTYNFSISQFTFQVSTGASVGFLVGTKGQYLEFGDPVQSKDTFSGLFKRAQYNYLFRTEIGYPITDKWLFSARPQLKVNLHSINEMNSSLNSKYFMYGINAGITYRF
jgi:hypothetical protein